MERLKDCNLEHCTPEQVPEHQSTDRKKLQKEAEAVAALKQKPPRLKLTKKQIIKTALLSLLFTMAGCGITFVISLLV